MLGQAGHFTGISQQLRDDSIDLVKYLEQFTGFEPLLLTSNAEATLREETIRRTKTVCTYCGVGCAFEVWTTGRKILKVEPNAEAPANGISTCIKGKFATSFVNAPDRLTKPLIRVGDRFEEVSWDEALSFVATRLREIQAKHGSEALAFISSSKTTNEECYLIQKLARAVFQTNNIDNCARYCQSPATKALTRTVGYGGDAGTIRDIEQADLVLIVGSHTATSHPVLAAKIKRQQKLRGQQVIVADLLEHEMARRADVFLRPHPGTDLIWINAVARHILERGWHAQDFIEARVHGLGEYARSLSEYTLAYAHEKTGLSPEVLADVAERIAKAERVCGLWAMGLTQRSNGTDTCTALSNLLLLTGNYGRPGTGAYPLRGHNNVQGACDVGALYDFLPGYEKVSDDAARRRFAEAWKVERLPDAPGLNNTTMLHAVHEGKLKAMYVIGEELGLVDANEKDVQRALRELEFLVVQEIFFSTTAHFADVILPGTPSLEKEGTFVNTERRIQRLYQVLEPLGDARPDWKILTDLAARLGHHWDYQHPSEIMHEMASCTPLFAGVSYERLEGWKSLCWPVREDGRDTPLLYEWGFPFPDGKAKFHPVEYTPPHVEPDAEYDVSLNNGRVLEHFHEGNLTQRCEGISSKVREAFVAVSAEFAQERNLEEGDYVRLTSKDGSLKTRVVISDEVTGKGAYMPVCSSEERVNMLTSSVADPVVDTPAYKEVVVKLEKVGRRGESPLPPGHPRYGAPTPRPGVGVTGKWERPDYRPPSEARPPEGKV